MSTSNALEKVTVDKDLIKRIRNFVSKPGNKLQDLIMAERKIVDDMVDEMVYEVAKGEGFDLDAYLAEEASRIHDNISANFNEKEAALLVYKRASERVREKWPQVKNLMVSNKSNFEIDFSKAQKEVGSIKYHLKLIELIRSRFKLEDFKDYDLADLALIFENLNDSGYIDDDNPELAAEKIIRKDANYLNELRKNNEDVRSELSRKEDILGQVY